MYKVLVPDYMGSQVIAGIRALKPNRVDLANHRSIMKYVKSRYINKLFSVPNPSDNIDGYISELMDLIEKNHYDLILPFGLDAYHACTMCQDILKKKTNFLLPSKNSLNLAADKEKSINICNDAGIECPKVHEVKRNDDIREISNNVKYPVVIKARCGTGVEKGLRYARNKNELVEKYREISAQDSYGTNNYDRPLVQEFIPGFIHDACTLTVNSNPINILTQVRQVMYPIYGGIGAINITTDDTDLRKIAHKTLEAFGWNGPAQIEFKYDPRDKKYKFIELNPKLWGTLDLSIKAGMNFPMQILDYATRRKLSPGLDYKVGVKYIFRYPQALFAMKQIRNEKAYYLLPNRDSYTETFTDFCWEDPIPDLARIIRAHYLLLFKGVNNNTNNVDLSTVYGI